MKRYDAWSEPEDAQRGYTTGSYRQELLEKTLGQYVTFDDHERAMSEITAERDRLAAENAELRQACDDFSKELSVQYQLELEAKCHDDLEKSHAIMVQVVAQRDAELAAANTTLDRLREIIPEHLTPGRAHRLYVNDVIRAKILLYPKETDNG